MIYECAGLARVVPAPDMELIVERDDPPTIIRCVILTPHVSFFRICHFQTDRRPRDFWKISRC